MTKKFDGLERVLLALRPGSDIELTAEVREMKTSVSERKAKANRENAWRSAGPKRTKGKAHTAQNASRHGLSPFEALQALEAEDIQDIARGLAAGRPELYSIALEAAELQVHIRRLHGERRHAMLKASLKRVASRTGQSDAPWAQELGVIATLGDIEAMAESERKATLRLHKLLEAFF